MRQKQKIKDYYRIGEVAKIVGVCSQTIRNYMFSNKLKYEVIKSGDRIKDNLNYAFTNSLFYNDEYIY